MEFIRSGGMKMVEMTKERAIEILKGLKVQNCSGCFHPQVVGFCEEQCSLPSAIKMAIDALKGENDG